jgi:outer membrane protein OmpA-like peptidoglycan-associated protein
MPEPAAVIEQAAPVVVAAPPLVDVPKAAAAEPAAPVVAPTVTNKVMLAGDALFKSGKSGIKDLSPEGKARLDEVIAKLKAVGEIEQIKVVGHADPTGNALSNRRLSEARAKSVKSYLIAKGITPGVIISSGMGDTQPVVQCDKSLVKDDLKACHAPNRRVEIEIAAKGK